MAQHAPKPPAPSPSKPHDAAVSEPGPPPRRRRRWVGRTLIVLAVLGMVGLVGLELFARYGLGLGDPPLYDPSPTMEYINKPDTTYHRFGNLLHFNHYSMRADDFPPTKAGPDEFRLIVMGDSVMHGGSLTDQSELATQRLIPMLRQALGRPVTVGNIAMGSWGPGNLLAWARIHGTLDADWVIIELASHDAQDARDYTPEVGVNPSYPDHAPLFALQESATRYLPRYLPDLGIFGSTSGGGGDEDHTPKIDRALDPAKVRQCSQALRALIKLIRAQGAKVAIAQHPDRAEATHRTDKPGHDVILKIARSMDVPTIQMREGFADVIDRGTMPYRDPIHPNPRGQQVIARQIFDFLVPRVNSSAGGRSKGKSERGKVLPSKIPASANGAGA